MDILHCHKVDQLIHHIFRYYDTSTDIDGKGVHDFEDESLVDAVLHVLNYPRHCALKDRLVIYFDQLCKKAGYRLNMIWIELWASIRKIVEAVAIEMSEELVLFRVVVHPDAQLDSSYFALQVLWPQLLAL